MKDPAGFMNNLQEQYNASPYNQYLQTQATRAGQNAASASGLMGSTPFLQQSQQNAANISQQGMDAWLKKCSWHKFAIRRSGNKDLAGMGQNSANNLTNHFENMGQNIGGAKYGSEAGKSQDFWNAIGGGIGMLGSFFL